MSIDYYVKDAEIKALKQGYDQIVFMSRNGVVTTDRLAYHSFKNPRWVIAYVRVTYKDGKLGVRVEKGEFDVKGRNMRQTA